MKSLLSSPVVRAFALVALGLSLPGCPFFEYGDDDFGYEQPPPPPSTPPSIPARVAPVIRNIDLPAFPPLGAEGTISVECEDSVGLSGLQIMFRDPASFPLSGTRQTVTLRGAQLGEGYGLLQLRLTNTRFASSERAVEHLLVDMTPPEIEILTKTVSPRVDGAEVALWVQDQWVLGFVELSFGGKTLRHDFPSAYPSTLGTSWDVSRVSFPAAELPEGAANAVIVTGDAAGNRSLREVPLVVDATAPVVSMQLPTEGQVVDGDFDVAVTASDPKNPVQVSVDLFVGGSLVGTVLGPSGSLTVDTASLPRGPVAVEAVAYDEAGNVSETSVVHVTVQ